MREVADADRIRRFMHMLRTGADAGVRVFFTGGATAVLFGWRQTTIDIDITIAPESDRVLRAIPHIKEALRANVKLVSPADFIPVPPGWEDRSRFIEHRGHAAFYHFDLYAQALAKVERGHSQDVDDVRSMFRLGLIEPERALDYFEAMEPELYRFPAIDPPSLRRAVEAIFAGR